MTHSLPDDDYVIDSIDINGKTHGLLSLFIIKQLARYYDPDEEQIVERSQNEITTEFERIMRELSENIDNYPFDDLILYSYRGVQAEDYTQFVKIPLHKVDDLEQIVSRALEERENE